MTINKLIALCVFAVCFSCFLQYATACTVVPVDVTTVINCKGCK